MQNVLSSVVGADDLGSPSVELSKYGKAVEENLMRMKTIYNDVEIDSYVIMPNHIHLLLKVNGNSFEPNGAPRSSPPTNTVSKFVSAFKKFSNKDCGMSIWQRGFYDHIIRDDNDYVLHLQYISENPKKWLIGKDEYYI